MERKVFLFIVLAFGLFVGKAQTVSKERLIEIADSVYNLPRFADYQIKNGEPVVIEKETIYLTPEELAKIILWQIYVPCEFIFGQNLNAFLMWL